jgi:hypothetical protein
VAPCFICGEMGAYKLDESTHVDPDNMLLACYLPSCGKAYHYDCLRTFPWLNTRGKILCPRHICNGCDKAFKSSKGVNHCTRCIKSYHDDCLPEGSIVLNHRYMVCDDHTDKPARSIRYPAVERDQRRLLRKAGVKIKNRLIDCA